MEVTYNLEAKDMMQFQRFWWNRRSRVKPWIFIVGLLTLLLISDLTLWGVWRSMLFSFVLPIPVIAIFVMLLLPIMAARQAKAMPGFVGLHTMAISHVGLTQKTSVTETKVQWPNVADIAEDEALIYVFLNQRSAFMIPKRGFAGPQEAQEYVELAKHYWKNQGQALHSNEGGSAWPPPPQTLEPW